jgi:endonuclease/exonuclease/phosphatase (EEP) superfamily protein YafD
VSIVLALAWAATCAGAAVLATQIAGWSRMQIVAVAQSLTPHLVAAASVGVVIGVADRRLPLVAAAGVVAAGLAAIVMPAIRFGRRPPPPPPPNTGSTLTVAHANLLYENVRLAREAVAAMLATDADVLAMSEFTPHHERAMIELDAAQRYPHRVQRSDMRSTGVALWSRLPISDVLIVPMDRRPGIVATVASAIGPLRIVLTHPDPPTSSLGLAQWESSLRTISALGRAPGPPTLIVGDLNAARWHPPFRRLLRSGWRDAHEEAGRGLGVSWPMVGAMPFPFVRLDHALLDGRLDAVAVRDMTVPGSDHRGFVVTVARRH